MRLVQLADGSIYIDIGSGKDHPSQDLFRSSQTTSKPGRNYGVNKQICVTPVKEGFDDNGIREWICREGLPSTSQMANIPGIFIRCLLKVPFVREPAESSELDPAVDTFVTRACQQSISWVLERESASGDDSQTGIFQATAYGSTLNYGWIPQDPAELINLLLQDLDRRWHRLHNEATAFLTTRRRVVLEKTGRDKGLIGLLIQDDLRWSRFDDVLGIQVKNIIKVLTDLNTNTYLKSSLLDNSGDQGKTAFGDVPPKIEALLRTTYELQEKVMTRTAQLRAYTGELISLEFNLVSITETQRSTAMSLSMKRLSWITFIFLPLMLASSIFGANINLLADNPEWWWMLVVAAISTSVTFNGWLVFRSGEVEKYWDRFHPTIPEQAVALWGRARLLLPGNQSTPDSSERQGQTSNPTKEVDWFQIE